MPELADYDKELIVRPLRLDDYQRIVRMQAGSFPHMRPWSLEQFASHIKHVSEGQIGIEYDGLLVASSSTLLLDFRMYRPRGHAPRKAAVHQVALRAAAIGAAAFRSAAVISTSPGARAARLPGHQS